MINLIVNFGTYCMYVVPTKIRGVAMKGWVRSLLAPISTLNGQFAAWAYAMRYDTRWNGEVIMLEHRLNDQFDAGLRRIYIDDPAGVEQVPLHVWNKAEQQNTLVVYNKSENQQGPFLQNKPTGTSDDFVVYVPASVHSAAVEIIMRKVINRYKIAGVNYSIITF